LPLDNTLVSYLFYWQKQSGIGKDPISLTINYPMFLKPIKLSSEAKSGQQTLTFTSDSGRDRLFAVTFSH
jgi:hypothetical protein